VPTFLLIHSDSQAFWTGFAVAVVYALDMAIMFFSFLTNTKKIPPLHFFSA
jgi:hypothetical protein